MKQLLTISFKNVDAKILKQILVNQIQQHTHIHIYIYIKLIAGMPG